MNCPYCGKEMENGFIQSRDELGWDKKKRFMRDIAGLFAEQYLGRTVIAYRCAECRKIVIDTDRPEA